VRRGERDVLAGEYLPHHLDRLASRGLVEGKPNAIRVDAPEIESDFLRALDDRPGLPARGDGERIEVRGVLDAEAEALEARVQDRGKAMDAPRDAIEPLRTVVNGIHGRHDREEHLRRADVRGRLLAPDVLLARLEREAISGRALRVDRHADEAPRHA